MSVADSMRTLERENIGLVVYAFKAAVESNSSERKFNLEPLDLRDALAKRIPSYETLIAPAH